MGYALAAMAARAGAEVTLVSGPTTLRPPEDVGFLLVESAADMATAVLSRRSADIVIMAAAVADYTRVIQANGFDDDAFKKRGDEYFVLGKYKEAVADYTEAIGLNAKLGAYFEARARAYEKLGDLEKAKVDRKMAGKLFKAPAVKKI